MGIMDFFDRLIEHPLYNDDITESDWEYEVTLDSQLEWLLLNVISEFSLIFCDYYYIVCFSSKNDLMHCKLVWDNV